MKKAGLIVLILTGVLAALSLGVWLLGLLTGFGGGLIHLLLVFVVLVAPAGVVTGVVLLLLGRRQAGPR